jgi:signal transduction histidine kinase/DNA-binding response OmpR family regulator
VITSNNDGELDRIFPGDSEMARRMRSLDWSQCPLGLPESWPLTLRTAIGICLTSRFPMHIWWGPSLTLFYNDAYISFLGRAKHPAVLGRPGSAAWSEIWDTISPMIQRVFSQGIASWSEDTLMFFDRLLPQEEVYVTFSFSPIFGQAGRVDGMYCACTETTDKIVGNRRVETLRKLVVEAAVARNVADACKTIGEVLRENPQDIPFSALYIFDQPGGDATLLASSGLSENGWRPPASISVAGNSAGRLFTPAIRSKRVEEVDLPAFGVSMSAEPWSEIIRTALVIPVRAGGSETLVGLLLAGVSTRRPLDAGYRTFLELVAAHIGTTISAAREYEKERARAETLAELDRAKTAFFSNVSHEFRSPLTLMLGPLEEELRENPTSSARLRATYRNALRLLKLVNMLLDFSRIEAHRIEAYYEPIDLGSFTAELASTFRSAAESAGLFLRIDCASLSERVYVDREMWEKIVFNLLSNALKFTFWGGITVRLCQQEQWAQLSISDSGVGIPGSELRHIFERFYRVRGTHSRTHEGSGIGLALVKELVSLHGGKLEVQSCESVGTTFTISIPTGSAHLPMERVGRARSALSPALAAAPFLEEARMWFRETAPARESETRSAQKGRTADERFRTRVLLADDNADIREYVGRLLAEHHDVTAVPDGEAALDAARKSPPDLVLSDVMMPRMDGYTLLKELRADPRTRSIPIILVSARAGEEARVEGIGYGADDYLIKPFSARELIARVNTHLELARVRRAAEEALRRGNEILEERVKERTRELQYACEALRDSEQKLRAGRDVTERLQEICTKLIEVESMHALYEEIIDASMKIVNADFSSLQSFDPIGKPGGVLHLLGYRGFTAEAADYWQVVHYETASGLGRALQAGERVSVENVENCPFFAGTRDLEYYRQCGIQSMQATPLFSRSGALLGRVSTYWRNPHVLTETESRSLDVFARVASDLLDRSLREYEREHQLAREFMLRSGAEAASRLKDEVMATVSHEIRTPADVILGWAQALQTGDFSQSERHSAFSIIAKNARTQTKIVDDLMDLSRVLDGKVRLRFRRVEISNIVGEAINLMQATAAEKGIAIHRQESDGGIVFADADRLLQIFWNLLSNAIKFTPSGGQIDVKLHRTQTNIEVSVSDTGPGFPEEFVPHPFEAFQRTDVMESHPIAGLGLGLAIAMHLVELHGATITATREPGTVATFTVCIPLAEEDALPDFP